MEKLMKECMEVFKRMNRMYNTKDTIVMLKYNGKVFSSYMDDEHPVGDGVPREYDAKTPEESLQLLLNILKEDEKKREEWLASPEYKRLRASQLR